MISYFKIISVFLLFITNINIVAQQKEKQIDLFNLCVEDENFLIIADKILIHEKNCDYYDSELVFLVSIKKYEKKFFISIESQKDINLLLSLNPYGYFNYRNHLFIVGGEQCRDIFSFCGIKTTFKYKDNTQYKKGEEVTIYIFNDDSFSQWNYWYGNKKFIEIQPHKFCN